MRLARIFAFLCGALALLVAGTNIGHASSFTCSSPGDLETAINGAQNTDNVLNVNPGTCTGGPFSIDKNHFTLNAPSGATINGQINVFAAGVTLSGLTIDGTGLSGPPDGVVVDAGQSVTLSNCTVQHWNSGVVVQLNGSAAISGGLIQSNVNGIAVQTAGSISVGWVPNFAPGASLPVEITGNTQSGIQLSGAGSALLNVLNIHANGMEGVYVSAGGSVTISSGTIDNNGSNGITASDNATVVFNTSFSGGSPTEIAGNGGAGIDLSGGSHVDIDQANIQTNTAQGISATGGGVGVFGGTIAGNGGGGLNLTHAAVKIRNTTISGNAGGPAIEAIFSTVDTKSSSFSVPATTPGQPAVFAYRSAVELDTDTVAGPGNANTLAVLGGSTMLLHATQITASDSVDPTVLVTDGSMVDSAGGNKIHNAAAADPAVAVANASTFHELTGPLAAFFAPSADDIIGTGQVQVQSNMELGTGSATSSSWAGNITVLQNSSFRMDGGMTITGTVTLGQSSNGFFNKVLGTNSVTKVTCAGTNTSHVGGPASVSPAVTIVTTGSGCYAF